MHWADINAAIYKAGSSPSQIAAHEGTQPSFVARVVRGEASSYRIASYLSVVTGIPLNRLFPDGRYNTPPAARRKKSNRHRGHDFPCDTFTTWQLCFCRHCGEEMAGRTSDDLQPLSDDERDLLHITALDEEY